MTGCYFWKNKKVFFKEGMVGAGAAREAGFLNVVCVDSTQEEIERRYGVFGVSGWYHVRLNEFPKEFRVHLLLLGVA